MERRAITVEGTVQGVGFRPFVYGLASKLDLHGFVRNETGGVRIEVEGESAALDEFLGLLARQPPPLARVEDVRWEPLAPQGDQEFAIEASVATESDDDKVGHPTNRHVVISPDVATCPDCLAEMLDPADRRHGYPFLNCTNCGPRLTIVTGTPYDRERTTMARFEMCPACRAEYEDPANRRFHAQPTACASCGPHLELLDREGRIIPGVDPLSGLADTIRRGGIGAMKGLGGFHLVCDASSPSAVAELRRRKHRDEKPFAIMVLDAAAARAFCEFDGDEQALLESPRRPIVLLRRRPSAAIAPGVAPGNPYLGVMLPYTPLHHPLLRALGQTPLVMTSGNRADEPIAYEDDDALQRLGEIVDLFLTHNRPIHVRCDDSVTRWVAGQEHLIRRSRGYAPAPLRLPVECPAPLLAVGGQLKGAFALGRERQAVLSHHLGDLDHYEAYTAFERDITLFEDLYGIKPAAIVHDLHPDYASTHYALRRGSAEALPCVVVQHHHAHMASCMAEHQLSGPVIGVSFDGTGYGTDGAIWGGEFLVGDYTDFRRAAHLRYVRMPGGDRAAREPWRMALAHLVDAGAPAVELETRIPPEISRPVHHMIETGFQAPLTSSAGRLFDAVSALAGVRYHASFEGQAPMELEALASVERPDGTYPFALQEDDQEQEPGVLLIDTRPLIQAIAADRAGGAQAGQIARRFHDTLVEAIAAVCLRLHASTGIETVTLSGGVFLNAVLAAGASGRLTELGFAVYRQHRVPPNDGGLCLGQLAVGARRLAQGGSTGLAVPAAAAQSPRS